MKLPINIFFAEQITMNIWNKVFNHFALLYRIKKAAKRDTSLHGELELTMMLEIIGPIVTSPEQEIDMSHCRTLSYGFSPSPKAAGRLKLSRKFNSSLDDFEFEMVWAYVVSWQSPFIIIFSFSSEAANFQKGNSTNTSLIIWCAKCRMLKCKMLIYPLMAIPWNSHQILWTH